MKIKINMEVSPNHLFAHACDVFLDDQELDACYEADEESGTVWVDERMLTYRPSLASKVVDGPSIYAGLRVVQLRGVVNVMHPLGRKALEWQVAQERFVPIRPIKTSTIPPDQL